MFQNSFYNIYFSLNGFVTHKYIKGHGGQFRMWQTIHYKDWFSWTCKELQRESVILRLNLSIFCQARLKLTTSHTTGPWLTTYNKSTSWWFPTKIKTTRTHPTCCSNLRIWLDQHHCNKNYLLEISSNMPQSTWKQWS